MLIKHDGKDLETFYPIYFRGQPSFRSLKSLKIFLGITSDTDIVTLWVVHKWQYDILVEYLPFPIYHTSSQKNPVTP